MDEGMDALLKRARQCAEEGAVVTIKLDGEQLSAGVSDIYTVAISGGKLSRDDFYRCDGADVAGLVEGALDHYQAARNRSPR